MRAITSFLFVGAAILASCSDDVGSKHQSPVPLAASLRSFESVEVTKRQLEARGWRDWRVVEEAEPRIPKGRPALAFSTYSVEGTDLNVEGTLRVDFLNGQLMATWFFPKEPERYEERVRGAGSLTGDSRAVRFGKDYQQRAYVRWEDTRLTDELEAWIKKYAGVKTPLPA